MKPHLRAAVQTLLERGHSQRKIAAETGVHRLTVAKIASKCATPATTGSSSDSENVPPRPSVQSMPSACEPHRAWIEKQVELDRNATAIHQQLVDDHDFPRNGYNSVKRFVKKITKADPERFDVLEFRPGEEAQVDFGLGAPTRRPGSKTYRRPYLFVMTLRYSRKCFRKVVWKADQLVWVQLHVEAWRSFGGTTEYVVLDNLKQGVIKPDLYEPALNPIYAALLEHMSVVADPCRVRDPNRKGTVESAIKHTQGTALKGKRFESIEEQNEFLAHWEENWAAQRTHGRAKRRVLDMYEEEKPHLRPLPSDPFRPFKRVWRTVNDSGLVQVNDVYYSALPAAVRTKVAVDIYENSIEILAPDGTVSRRHAKSDRRGAFVIDGSDRIFNPTRETAKLLSRVSQIGPNSKKLGERIIAHEGRPAQRQLYGLANLAKTYSASEIEAAATDAVQSDACSYGHVKAFLESQKVDASSTARALVQAGDEIRPIDEYASFFDRNTRIR